MRSRAGPLGPGLLLILYIEYLLLSNYERVETLERLWGRQAGVPLGGLSRLYTSTVFAAYRTVKLAVFSLWKGLGATDPKGAMYKKPAPGRAGKKERKTGGREGARKRLARPISFLSERLL